MLLGLKDFIMRRDKSRKVIIMLLMVENIVGSKNVLITEVKRGFVGIIDIRCGDNIPSEFVCCSVFLAKLWAYNHKIYIV